MNRNLLIVVSIAVISCGENGAKSVSSESGDIVGTCQETQTSHQGCCSSHGGFTGNCAAPEVMYTEDGRLICDDNTISPTCTR